MRQWLATVLREYGDGIAIVESCSPVTGGTWGLPPPIFLRREADPSGGPFESRWWPVVELPQPFRRVPRRARAVHRPARGSDRGNTLDRSGARHSSASGVGRTFVPPAAGVQSRLMDLLLDESRPRRVDSCLGRESIRPPRLQRCPGAALLTSDISRLDAAATKRRLSIGGET